MECFDSILVRLKAKRYISRYHNRNKGFDSILVRLKVETVESKQESWEIGFDSILVRLKDNQSYLR